MYRARIAFPFKTFSPEELAKLKELGFKGFNLDNLEQGKRYLVNLTLEDNQIEELQKKVEDTLRSMLSEEGNWVEGQRHIWELKKEISRYMWVTDNSALPLAEVVLEHVDKTA